MSFFFHIIFVVIFYCIFTKDLFCSGLGKKQKPKTKTWFLTSDSLRSTDIGYLTQCLAHSRLSKTNTFLMSSNFAFISGKDARNLSSRHLVANRHLLFYRNEVIKIGSAVFQIQAMQFFPF